MEELIEPNAKLREVSIHRFFALAVAAGCMLICSCGSKTIPPATKTNELQSLAESHGEALNYIDSINGIKDLSHGVVRIPRGKELKVVGWAVDSIAKLPAKKVYIDVDGQLYVATYGVSRPDVVAALKIPEFEKSGFIATIPGLPVEIEHQLSVKIVSADGVNYFTGMSVTFISQ